MDSKTSRLIRVIETYLFGEYFKNLAQGKEMKNVSGSINTKENGLNMPRFESIDECKELLNYLGKERGLIDSKYDYMGNYTITGIDFHYLQISIEGNTDIAYYPIITIQYWFDNLDWNKIKNTHDN